MSTISDNDPEAPEVTPEEAWYDAEIAPALHELGKRCQERGVPFLAVVEYQPGDRGRSFFMPEHAGLAMTMVHLCAASAPNIDAYFIALARHCRRQGIDTSASFVMRALHQPAEPVAVREIWTCQQCGHEHEGPISAPAAQPVEPVAVPAGMSRSDAEFWLRHRAEIIEALEVEGYRIVSIANKVALMDFDLDRIERDLASPAAPAAQAWQPIETAPRETEVLVGRLVNGEWRICQSGYYFDGGNEREGEPSYWYWHCDWDQGGVTDSEGPTHWMHLPSAPADHSHGGGNG